MLNEHSTNLDWLKATMSEELHYLRLRAWEERSAGTPAADPMHIALALCHLLLDETRHASNLNVTICVLMNVTVPERREEFAKMTVEKWRALPDTLFRMFCEARCDEARALGIANASGSCVYARIIALAEKHPKYLKEPVEFLFISVMRVCATEEPGGRN